MIRSWPSSKRRRKNFAMANQFPPSGVLWTNDNRTNPKAPGRRGTLEIGADVLQYLNKAAMAGHPIEMELAGWDRVSKDGNEFISLTAQAPRQQSAQQSPQRAAPKTNYDPRARPSFLDDDDDSLPF